MPEVEEQHYAVGGAVVHDLVLPRVVEDQALALGPLALKVLSLLRPVHMPAECVTVRRLRLIKLT